MSQRSMTNETARCPICRYGVCPRSHSASIIELSKCVRRHQVTKLFGLPAQRLFCRNGVTASVSPFCMSTIVPYWSKISTLISRLMISARSMAGISSPSSFLNHDVADGTPWARRHGARGESQAKREGRLPSRIADQARQGASGERLPRQLPLAIDQFHRLVDRLHGEAACDRKQVHPLPGASGLDRL